jgi:hypothetical protein
LVLHPLQHFPADCTNDQASFLVRTLASLCPRLEHLELEHNANGQPVVCFFSSLASSGLPLSHLSVGECRKFHELMSCLSRFTGLRSLHVSPGVDTEGMHDVSPLASLHQLQDLAIDQWSRVRGLQAVLSSCTQLRCLRLGCDVVVQESPLHSPSLQELWLTDLRYLEKPFSPPMLPHGLDLPRLPALQKVCVHGVDLCGSTPEQVQQLAVALAGWPVEPVRGEFVVFDPSQGGALLQVLACPQLQSAAWPKRVGEVTVRASLGPEGEGALRSVFTAAVLLRGPSP